MGDVYAQETSFPNSKVPTSNKNSPVSISADHIMQGTNKESVLAWGRVKIEHQKRTLWADKVMIDNTTGIGKAQGHVIFEGEDGTRMKAKETLFDLKSHQGKLLESKTVLADKFRISAKEIKRLSANHFPWRIAL